MSTSDLPVPAAQYIGSEQVMRVLADHGRQRLDRLTSLRIFALAVLAGGFITTGALMSVLLAVGARPEGLVRLLEGFGFSAGFFFVILSGTVLFTEANVVLPWCCCTGPRGLASAGAAVLGAGPGRQPHRCAAGGGGVRVPGELAGRDGRVLRHLGRTIIGKYVPVVLAVTAFVAAGFQHSPANMGYFSLAAAFGQPDWGAVLAWNLLPAGFGNILGGGLAVAALLGWAYARYQTPPPATPVP